MLKSCLVYRVAPAAFAVLTPAALAQPLFDSQAPNLGLPGFPDGDNVRTVVLSGAPIPGVPGLNFGSTTGPGIPSSPFVLGNVVLNDLGQTAFDATLAGPGVGFDNNQAIFVESPSGLVTLAQEAGPLLPGAATPGVTLNFIFSPLLNNAGEVLVEATLQGPDITFANDDFLFGGSPDNLQPVALSSNPAPGTGLGIDFDSISDPAFNNNGAAAFEASLTGFAFDVSSDADTAIFTDAGGSLGLVAREGDAVPGLEPGVNFGSLTSDAPSLNDNGQVAFFASLAGPAVNDDNNSAVFLADPTSGVAVVAREGDAAPGLAGVLLGGISSSGSPAVVLNNAGQLTFASALTGAGVTGDNNSALLRAEADGTLGLIAREGDAAPSGSDPDTPAGLTFGSLIDPDARINAQGRVVFGATIGDGVSFFEQAVFTDDVSDGLELVALSGTLAAGTDANFNQFGDESINALGQVAFAASLETSPDGSPVDDTNDFGLFATDINGDLQLIARTGDLLDVSDDPLIQDLRTIAEIGFETGSGGEDGLSSGLNNLGQVAFFASFTDGTDGVFVSSRVAVVPEPTTFGVLGLVGLALTTSRRRHLR